jgi:transposase
MAFKRPSRRSERALLYLPPYSQDFNPIEMAFSKLKALLRRRRTHHARSLAGYRKYPQTLLTQRNVKTISPRLDTMQHDRKML